MAKRAATSGMVVVERRVEADEAGDAEEQLLGAMHDVERGRIVERREPDVALHLAEDVGGDALVGLEARAAGDHAMADGIGLGEGRLLHGLGDELESVGSVGDMGLLVHDLLAIGVS